MSYWCMCTVGGLVHLVQVHVRVIGNEEAGLNIEHKVAVERLKEDVHTCKSFQSHYDYLSN